MENLAVITFSVLRNIFFDQSAQPFEFRKRARETPSALALG